MRKIFVVVKTQFSAIHCWSECNIDRVSFLKNPHRHVFYVTLKYRVSHAGRDKEFLCLKDEVDEFIAQMWKGKNVGQMSCEDLAIRLFDEFNASFVSVFEDNENGAEVWV